METKRLEQTKLNEKTIVTTSGKQRSSIILSVVLCLLMASSVYAGSGKATVPAIWVYKYASNNYIVSKWFIANITNHPVRVSIKAYDRNGAFLPANFISYVNFTNSDTEIAAKSTGSVEIVPPTASPGDWGRATIEWQNVGSDDDTVALIAHVHITRVLYDQEQRFSVEIHQGEPF